LADDGDVDTTKLVSSKLGFGREPHGGAEAEELAGAGGDDFRHAIDVGEFPIAPDELADAIGEVGFRDGGRGGRGLGQGGGREGEKLAAVEHEG
jgi:hypothetical protein